MNVPAVSLHAVYLVHHTSSWYAKISFSHLLVDNNIDKPIQSRSDVLWEVKQAWDTRKYPEILRYSPLLYLVDQRRHVGTDTVVVQQALDTAKSSNGDLAQQVSFWVI